MYIKKFIYALTSFLLIFSIKTSFAEDSQQVVVDPFATAKDFPPFYFDKNLDLDGSLEGAQVHVTLSSPGSNSNEERDFLDVIAQAKQNQGLWGRFWKFMVDGYISFKNWRYELERPAFIGYVGKNSIININLGGLMTFPLKASDFLDKDKKTDVGEEKNYELDLPGDYMQDKVIVTATINSVPYEKDGVHVRFYRLTGLKNFRGLHKTYLQLYKAVLEEEVKEAPTSRALYVADQKAVVQIISPHTFKKNLLDYLKKGNPNFNGLFGADSKLKILLNGKEFIFDDIFASANELIEKANKDEKVVKTKTITSAGKSIEVTYTFTGRKTDLPVLKIEDDRTSKITNEELLIPGIEITEITPKWNETPEEPAIEKVKQAEADSELLTKVKGELAAHPLLLKSGKLSNHIAISLLNGHPTKQYAEALSLISNTENYLGLLNEKAELRIITEGETFTASYKDLIAALSQPDGIHKIELDNGASIEIVVSRDKPLRIPVVLGRIYCIPYTPICLSRRHTDIEVTPLVISVDVSSFIPSKAIRDKKQKLEQEKLDKIKQEKEAEEARKEALKKETERLEKLEKALQVTPPFLNKNTDNAYTVYLKGSENLEVPVVGFKDDPSFLGYVGANSQLIITGHKKTFVVPYDKIISAANENEPVEILSADREATLKATIKLDKKKISTMSSAAYEACVKNSKFFSFLCNIVESKYRYLDVNILVLQKLDIKVSSAEESSIKVLNAFKEDLKSNSLSLLFKKDDLEKDASIIGDVKFEVINPPLSTINPKVAGLTFVDYFSKNSGLSITVNGKEFLLKSVFNMGNAAVKKDGILSTDGTATLSFQLKRESKDVSPTVPNATETIRTSIVVIAYVKNFKLKTSTTQTELPRYSSASTIQLFEELQNSPYVMLDKSSQDLRLSYGTVITVALTESGSDSTLQSDYANDMLIALRGRGEYEYANMLPLGFAKGRQLLIMANGIPITMDISKGSKTFEIYPDQKIRVDIKQVPVSLDNASKQYQLYTISVNEVSGR